jgi:hypothetical protein
MASRITSGNRRGRRTPPTRSRNPPSRNSLRPSLAAQAIARAILHGLDSVHVSNSGSRCRRASPQKLTDSCSRHTGRSVAATRLPSAERIAHWWGNTWSHRAERRLVQRAARTLRGRSQLQWSRLAAPAICMGTPILNERRYLLASRRNALRSACGATRGMWWKASRPDLPISWTSSPTQSNSFPPSPLAWN